MHIKYVNVAVLLLTLTGCVSNASFDTNSAKETMLVNTKNYPELISFYKSQLREKNTRDVREKLSQTYLDYGDAESALFTIEQLNDKSPTINSLLIQANSEFEQGYIIAALATTKRAYELEDDNAEVENLLGVIYASEGDITQARHYFNLARKHLYDDIKIKNNLAVLDIVEGQYEVAIKRLLPVYMNEKLDDQVQANLMMAMAKAGDFDLMKRVLALKFNEREITERYLALKGAEPLSTGVAMSTADPDMVDEHNAVQ
ncbi:hypothetical protein [Photobacterium ganghwense]|uniref:hypothetical protein n=1 Tax=Photobacterium ganghwense TaxID=320778 RepID=UPI001C2CC8EF|nr:hypothetical protein [Photobacterium ganghwense]MBV1843127.1 hypothetical protein [Photobacterium ganghwense]